MNKRDLLDIEISERQQARAKRFDTAEGRPDYTALPTQCAMSPTAFRDCARRLGASFVYNLYVSPVKLLSALNICKQLMCQTKGNPFAPYVNIVETEDFDEGEWCFEANDKRVGSNFPW